MAPAEPPRPGSTHDRRQMAWAAAAVVFGGVPHMFSVVPWVPVLVLAIALWRIAAAAQGWRLPSLWVRVPVTVMAFLGVAFTYRSVSGIEAGSALLLVMGGMKLLETRSERDRILVVFIGYFLLFAVFLREQAIWSMVWLAGAAVAITAALIQTTRRERLLPVADAALLSGRLLLQALPLALVLFVLFPRVPGPFWSLPSQRLENVSGLSEEMRPGDITALSLSDEVAFRVRFDARVPPAGSMYWRGPVLERFDGRAWSVMPGPPRATGVPPPSGSGPVFDYQVVLEPQGKRWLLALETPLRWSVPRAELSPAMQLLHTEPVWERLAYEARSVASGVGATRASAEVLAANLRLPAGTNPRARRLAADLRRQAASDRDFITRALRLFRDQPFYYSLTPPALGANPVDDFLFRTREGFCEHYASAMAVLARAGGVPARVVVGYQGGERNPFGDYWIVRQANAHAWVEAWLDGAWRRIDPTAAVAPGRIERGIEETLAATPRVADRLWRSNALVNGVVLSWDAANAAWDRWVLAYGPEMQDDLMLALGFEVPRTLQLAGLTGLATVLCLLVMAWTLRHRDRRRRDRSARLYAEACRRLAPLGRPRAPSESPGHYAAAIAAARPDLAGDVHAITELYLSLRYGGTADAAGEVRLAALVRRLRPRPAPG